MGNRYGTYYNEDKSSTNSAGIGFIGLLAIAFIVLKLMEVIAWSWFWVLSPIWIPFAIAIVVFIIALIVAAVT